MGPRVLEITPDIVQIGGPSLTHANDAAVYLVHFGDHAALVDSGSGRASERLLVNLEATGIEANQIRYLVLTHCHYDHSGGAAYFRQRFHWPIALHALEVPYLERGDSQVSAASWYGDQLTPCPVDLSIGDGDRLELGDRSLSVIHLPGHSPGSVAYLVESEGKRVVFAQDVHGPLHPALLSNAEDYQRSLQKLLALDADILCEGHYGVFVGATAIAGFIRRFVED